MKKWKQFCSLAVCLGMCVAMMGCGADNNEKEETSGEKKKIVIGTEPSAAPSAECIQPVLEKEGYEVEITYFDDYVLPDTALVEGSIDCNIYQHTPYMEMYNEDHDTDLMMAGLIAFPNIGIYSTKYDSLDEIPDGSQVSITNDASNEDRALRLLQEAGLITLPDKPENGELYTISEIADNPKNLEFVSIADTQLVESMNDVAISVCPSSHILENGLDPESAFIMEEPNEDAMIGLTIRPEDQDAQWVQDVLAAYSDESAREAFDEEYQGAWQLVIE